MMGWVAKEAVSVVFFLSLLLLSSDLCVHAAWGLLLFATPMGKDHCVHAVADIR